VNGTVAQEYREAGDDAAIRRAEYVRVVGGWGRAEGLLLQRLAGSDNPVGGR